MLVPEATMNLDHLIQPREYEIGAPGESVNVKPISEAHAMNETANNHLGRCILTADTAHVLAPLFSGNFVQCSYS
jgi:hypothetical protein